VVVAVPAVSGCARAGTGGAADPAVAVPGVPHGRYVALGDSYVAGPGVPALTGLPLGCGRSSANYPSVVRAGAGLAVLRDVSCSGATTADMTAAQQTRTGPNPAQLDALSPDTTLVTLTVGGNDIGFSDILTQCLARSGDQPGGAACRAHFTRSGRDLLGARIAATAPKLAAVLRDIGRRAPAATLLVVGYPTILPGSGAGCPEAPFSAGDIAYLNRTFRALDGMLEQQARAAGDRFVDTAASSVGHDVCAPPASRWVEGRAPSSPAAAFHPNAAGMRNTGEQVLDALRPSR
jgi:lysophospholipase L1-like esterase